MDVSKNRGKTTKMDGENNGKPYEQMDDLGGNVPLFLEGHPYHSDVFLPTEPLEVRPRTRRANRTWKQPA